MPKIRLYIADDHPLVIEGLIQVLSKYPELEIEGTFEDGAPLLKAMFTQSVDLVITDLRMKDMDGIEVCKNIRKLFPQTKVLILTMYKEYHYQQKVIEAGANGCLLKSSRGSEILEAIQKVLAGEQHFIGSQDPETDTKQMYLNVSLLTDREKDILKYIAEGYSNMEIAEHLTLSVHTIKTHRKNIQGKLNIHKTSQLVSYAIQQGLMN